MKAALICGLALAAFILPAVGEKPWTDGPNEILILRYGEGDGNWNVYSVIVERAKSQPTWSPPAEAMPLPMAKAIEIGVDWTMKRRPEIKNFELSAIEIERIGSSSARDCWCYHLTFNSLHPFDRVSAIVLMDGSVVEPKLVHENGGK